MDASPPPHSDMPHPPEPAASRVAETEAARHTELLLDALRAALAAPGEHRLFRSGKLAGLFPSRAGSSADAALAAIREGLLETVRTETRGKVVTEWVKATPKAVAFVHDHDSPQSVLRELKDVLDTARDGIPSWLTGVRAELAGLSARFESHAEAVLKRLDELATRAEAALRRAEAKASQATAPAGRVASWATDTLEYLDRRAAGGAPGACPLPELFHALRVKFPSLSLLEFQAGMRRLHDVRALRLTPVTLMTEPEYALVVEGQLVYAVIR